MEYYTIVKLLDSANVADGILFVCSDYINGDEGSTDLIADVVPYLMPEYLAKNIVLKIKDIPDIRFSGFANNSHNRPAFILTIKTEALKSLLFSDDSLTEGYQNIIRWLQSSDDRTSFIDIYIHHE